MNIFIAFVLGIVQGLSEFLPISSSGHLILVRSIFGIQGDYILFDIALHIGTLLAVTIFFWRELTGLLKPPFNRLFCLIVATIPAIITGLLLKDYIAILFASPKYLFIFFMMTGILLFITNLIIKNKKEPKTTIGIKTAIAMGLAQGVAIIPGVSRSGSTIASGVASNVDRTTVAKFSFLMSVPIILGSLILELSSGNSVDINIAYLFVGIITSFVSGLFAIKFMMQIVQKANLNYFALYLLLVSIITFFVYFVS